MSTTTTVPERKTLSYFYREILRFRRLWDQQAFWNDDAMQERALGGLTLVFLNLDVPAAEEESAARVAFYSTTDEYSRRRAHVDVSRIFGRSPRSPHSSSPAPLPAAATAPSTGKAVQRG